ncbi:MAG: 3'-5' exonuclease [Kiritimatiellales bacterium]
MLIRETAVTVLDFETTGAVPGFDNEPWQIGLVVLRAGKIDPASLFETLICVDANRPFNAYAPGKHHALRDAIAGAPPACTVWKNIEPLLAGPLAAHNVAVEKKFLRKMAPLHPYGPWIDTLKLARRAWPKAPSHTLGDLVAGLNLEPRIREFCPNHSAHDALYDAVACAALLEFLLQQNGWEDLEIM